MSKSKMTRQTTLFQSWGNQTSTSHPGPAGTTLKTRIPRPEAQQTNCVAGSGTSPCDDIIDLSQDVHDEDLLVAMAMAESLKNVDGDVQKASKQNQNVSSHSHDNHDSGKTLFSTIGSPHLAFNLMPEPSNVKEMQWTADEFDLPDGCLDALMDSFVDTHDGNIEDIPGFDKSAGRLWIYPTNYPVRDYQFNIVQEALFKNTLVTLPTGLGKTFIAAVVMYNFYRWYPQGKIIFMAPTKPLVAQQIEACYNIMGIPQEDAAEMTGAMQPKERLLAWRVKRVFYLTPQVLTNDLSRGACPALEVKCLVVDEAHKALGNHAYCQVVRELAKHEGAFRVLALSATPGSDIRAVQQVLNNLLISHIELRTEECADIQPYTHERKVEKIVVPLGEQLVAVKDQYLRILDNIVCRLKRQGVMYNRNTESLSKFMVLKARDGFRQDPPSNLARSQFGVIEADFALCMSLYHGFELLQLHGLRSLYNYLEGIVSGDKGYFRTRSELQRNHNFCELMDSLRGMFKPVKHVNPHTQDHSPSASQRATPFVVGHPKMEKLQEVVLEHFQKFQDDTRVMIFSQYRDSVSEITEMLNRHRPLVKVMSFIGQSSANKAMKGFTQKEQLRVMRKFRDGGYNTLVSTCVGEEGLDIGDVDLIICFDASKSPIRLVQRMGRTGRKRNGRIIMLVTKGKEEQIYNQSQFSKRSIHRAILNGTKSLLFYPHNQRMVPQGLQPRCHKMYITVEQRFKAPGKRREKGAGQAKINSMLQAPDEKADKDSGFLSEAELQYWSEHYKVPDTNIPCWQHCPIISVKKGDSLGVEDDKRPKLLLSAWTPWQNRLQKTIRAGHSMQSKHLVDLMEFMEVQAAIQGDEDSYGLEMQAYLDEDDIIRPKKNSSLNKSILAFCTPSLENNHSGQGRKKTTGQEGGGSDRHDAKKPRRSEQLPEFSSPERTPNSDDELPAFDVAGDKHTKCQSASCDIEMLEIHDGNLNKKSEKLTGKESDLTKTCDRSVEALDKSTRIINTKKKCQAAKSCKSRSIKDMLSQKTKVTKKKKHRQKGKRKHNRSSDMSESVIELLDDVDDFVQPNSSKMEIDVQEITAESPELFGVKWKKEKESFHLSSKKDNTVSIAETEMIENQEQVTSSEGNVEMISLQDTMLSQMFPLFTPQKCFVTYKPSEEGVPQGECGSPGCLPVKTPPPIEELHAAMEELDKKGRLSPVDLLDLVDRWEKERHSDLSVSGLECKRSLNLEGPCTYEHVGSKPKVSVPIHNVQVYSGSAEKEAASKNSFMHSEDKENESTMLGSVRDNMEEVNAGISVTEKTSAQKTSNADCNEEPRQVKKKPLFKQQIPQLDHVQRLSCSIKYHTENELKSSHIPIEKKCANQGMDKSMDIDDGFSPLDIDMGLLQTPFSSYGQKKDGDVSEHCFVGEVVKHNITSPKLGEGAGPNDGLGAMGYSDSASVANASMEFKSAFEMLKETNVKERTDKCVVQVQSVAAFDSPKFDLGHITHRNSSTPVIKRGIGDGHESVSSEGHQSFFQDDMNDSLFAAMQTPVPSHGRPKTQPLETSQITFTQALACVHQSFAESPAAPPTRNPHTTTRTSEEELFSADEMKQDADFPTKRKIKIFDARSSAQVCTIPGNKRYKGGHNESTSKAEKQKSVLLLNNEYDCDSNNLLGNGQGDRIKTDCNKNSTDLNISGDNMKEPQFDLGFDLDLEDFDEEIVPPSPVHARPVSQKVGSSQTFCNLGIANPADATGQDHTAISCGSSEKLPTSVPDNSNSESDAGGRSPSLISRPVIQDQQISSTSAITKPNLSIPKKSSILPGHLVNINVKGTGNTSFRPGSPPVAIVTPQKSCTTDVSVKDNDAAESSWDAQNVQHASNSVVGGQTSENAESPKQENGSSPPCDSSGDDSFIQMGRKKRTAVLMSPESPIVQPSRHSGGRTAVEFKTPVRPMLQTNKHRLTQTRKVIISSDEGIDSPVRPRHKYAMMTWTTSERDEDEDDFQDAKKPTSIEYTHAGKRQKAKEREGHSSVRGSRKAKKRSKGCAFIEEEAELSEEEDKLSSDESESDLDDMDQSFIDDNTQLSQPQGHGHPDMRAVYMRSVHSPTPTLPGRFKLKYGDNGCLGVFSQVPPEDESQYLEDSFINDGDEDEEMEVTNEPEGLLDDKSFTVGVRTRRGRQIAQLKRQQAATRRERKPKPGRRRLVVASDSTSDEEEGSNIRSEEPVPQGPNIHRVGTAEEQFKTQAKDRTECKETYVARVPEEKIQTKKVKGRDEHSLNVSSTEVTQLPSLYDRCQGKLEKQRGIERYSHSKVPPKNECNPMQSVMETDSTEVGHFELDDFVDFSDDVDDKTEISTNGKVPKSTEIVSFDTNTNVSLVGEMSAMGKSRLSLQTSANGTGSSTSRKKLTNDAALPGRDRTLDACHTNTVDSVADQRVSSCGTGTQTEAQLREQRLRKSRLLQEQFRKKYANQQQSAALNEKTGTMIQTGSPSSDESGVFKVSENNTPFRSDRKRDANSSEVVNGHSSQICSFETPKATIKSTPKNATPENNCVKDVITSQLSERTRNKDKLVILVDSREINGAQDLVSALRLKHKLNVVVRQLEACDYVVSKRMAVERKNISDFSNGANRAKLLERMRHMCELYDRPCIIVEKDRIKPGQEKNVPTLLKTKYIENVLASLAMTHIKVLFTESQEGTAELLGDLCSQEHRKQMAITSQVDLSPQQEQVLQFYLSLPKVSYVTALTMLLVFKSPAELIYSSSVVLQKRTGMSVAKAEEIHRFLHYNFDPCMMGIKK